MVVASAGATSRVSVWLSESLFFFLHIQLCFPHCQLHFPARHSSGTLELAWTKGESVSLHLVLLFLSLFLSPKTLSLLSSSVNPTSGPIAGQLEEAELSE